jgi:putative transposase
MRVFQADHCQLRIFVRNERGKAQMPLLTAIEDDYSRCLAGYRLSWSAPSALQTALTLRGAIRVKEDPSWPVHGVPECLYRDHGSDFTSLHMEAVAADLKMSLLFSQVGRPRGRGKVERFFRTVREEVLACLPGYAPKVKDDLRCQRELEAEARNAACLSLSEFEGIFRNWLLKTYHRRKHTETSAAPTERWLDSGVIPILPEDDAQLDLLLLQPRRRCLVHQEGITFKGAWYMHELLAGHVKEAVIIRYDPMDLATIRVYEGENEERFLCQASCVERGGPAVSLQAIQASRTKRRQAVGNALRERKRVVARYASPEHQAMRALEKGAAMLVPAHSDERGSADEAESVAVVSERPKKPSTIRWYDDE